MSEPTVMNSFNNEETNNTSASKESFSKIYLGPNLAGGRLLQSTVFRNELPDYLQPLLDEQPEAAELIVPIAHMAEVQARLTQQGTAEFAAYKKLLGKGN
ncbi:hypothetical protein F4V43_11265 [Paenibacillus spiritus]|uniref:Uncharacterized protein n=1 Tax=Paenibacillus spiritus TaxID=2496557 RepID=A0A5J5GA51_9BACL|nr:hypothetical protein [Paenibacillus spiritus]KAA9003985.1 hypothetical protein F4V43_11265 [Paenibacillus spiritus]